MKSLLATVLLTTLIAPVWAAQKTVTLSLPTMDCPVCPITVKKALTQVSGVSRAEVNFSKRLVVVTFDDVVTNLNALTRATKDAGYPSTLTDSAK